MLMLKARITAAITSVYADILVRTWRKIDHNLYILREMNGAHVEVH